MASAAKVAIQLIFRPEKMIAYIEHLRRRQQAIHRRNEAFVNTIGVFVFQDIMDHFKKEMGSEGPWKQWSRIYAEHMDRVGKGGNNILQDTGHLRDAFTAGNWRTRFQGIEWYNPAKTKSGFPYAAAHDKGGPKLPKRDFMWLSDTAMEKITKATVAFMAGD